MRSTEFLFLIPIQVWSYFLYEFPLDPIQARKWKNQMERPHKSYVRSNFFHLFCAWLSKKPEEKNRL